MPLPSTGAISLGQVNVELSKGATVPISLGDTAVRALAGKPSGPVSLGDLLGKTINRWQFNVKYTGDPSGNAWYGYNNVRLQESLMGVGVGTMGSDAGICAPTSLGGAAILGAYVDMPDSASNICRLIVNLKDEGTDWKGLRSLTVAGVSLPGAFVLCDNIKIGLPTTYYWTPGGPVGVESYSISIAQANTIFAAMNSPQGATFTFDRPAPPQ